MQSMLSIPVGLLLEVALFFVLYRLSPLNGRQAAVLLALLSLALYMPYALWHWPGADVVALHVAIFLMAAYVLGLITTPRRRGPMDRHDADSTAGFHWAPALIIGFFVVVVLFGGMQVVVSTRGLPEPLARLMLPTPTVAKRTHSVFPGVVDRNFQKKEAQYNAYLAQVEAQQARGWQVDKGWLANPVMGQEAVFQVRVSTREGEALTEARVSAEFMRPSDSRKDVMVELQEIDAGLYQAVLVLPEPGLWTLALNIVRGEARHELNASTQVAAQP